MRSLKLQTDEQNDENKSRYEHEIEKMDSFKKSQNGIKLKMKQEVKQKGHGKVSAIDYIKWKR